MKQSRLWQDTFHLLAGGKVTRYPRPGEKIAAPTPDFVTASPRSSQKLFFFVRFMLGRAGAGAPTAIEVSDGFPGS